MLYKGQVGFEFLEKKVGNFGICWDISNIFTDSESAFKSGQFEHLKTIVAWILGTRTFVLNFSFDFEIFIGEYQYQRLLYIAAK